MTALAFIDTRVEKLQTVLYSGSDASAILALTTFSLITVVPPTLIQKDFFLTSGYGASVAAMSLAMMRTFDIPFLLKLPSAPAFLACCAFIYGLRLAGFILLRKFTVKNMWEQNSLLLDLPWVTCLTLAAACSFLYACMLAPLLFALRSEKNKFANGVLNDTTKNAPIYDWLQWTAVIMICFGLALEAASDQHKFIVKRQHGVSYGEKRFVGPVNFAFAVCRHPNFLGEIIFWTSLYLGGAPSFGRSYSAWSSSSFGLFSIVTVMLRMAKKLDKKQEMWYKGQSMYEEWKRRVPASLFPNPLSLLSVRHGKSKQ